MKLYSVTVENGGKDALDHKLEYVYGMTGVIQKFMAASENPKLYRFTAVRLDDVRIEGVPDVRQN